MEKKKPATYIKYAVGEIILVVIGILIALQINNWNERQKEQTQEIIYLQNLKDDLKAQIAELEGYIDFENIIIEQSAAIITHYEVNKGFTNMDSIYPKLNDLSVRWTFSNANMTLLEMINSGQINLISNKALKKELIEFNQLLESFSKNTQNNNTNLIDRLIVPTIMESSPYAYYGYSDRMRTKFKAYYLEDLISVKDKELATITDQLLQIPENRLELINNVVIRNGMANLQKNGNASLKANAQQVLLNIESELTKHGID